MQKFGIASVIISFAVGAGTVTTVYSASRISQPWRERVRVAVRLPGGRTRLTALPLDTHIASDSILISPQNGRTAVYD